MSEKRVTDQAKDAAQGAKEGVAGMSVRDRRQLYLPGSGTPSMFDKDGAVGKQFQAGGAVSLRSLSSNQQLTTMFRSVALARRLEGHCLAKVPSANNSLLMEVLVVLFRSVKHHR